MAILDDEFAAAAHVADDAVNRAMLDYADGLLPAEDDITPWLASAIQTALTGKIGGLIWRTGIVNHRSGRAAEEGRIGADLIIHYKLDTPEMKFSKGILIQAKKLEMGHRLGATEFKRLKQQCEKMLGISSAAYVWNYATIGMRCGSANRVVGLAGDQLWSGLEWTSYRFFLEFLRCSIGDRSIGSALSTDLVSKTELTISATRGEHG